jgi:hypothetical protein
MADTRNFSTTPHGTPKSELLAFTLDTSTGDIIKIENVDSAGHRRELSKTERQQLAKDRPGIGVDALVERAFEAGIACVSDDDDSDEDDKESKDEAGVRRILLNSLMERTFARRALRAEVLRQAIVQTLIKDGIGFGQPESEHPKPHKSDRTGPKAAT